MRSFTVWYVTVVHVPFLQLMTYAIQLSSLSPTLCCPVAVFCVSLYSMSHYKISQWTSFVSLFFATVDTLGIRNFESVVLGPLMGRFFVPTRTNFLQIRVVFKIQEIEKVNSFPMFRKLLRNEHDRFDHFFI